MTCFQCEEYARKIKASDYTDTANILLFDQHWKRRHERITQRRET